MTDIVERLTEAAAMRDELKERYWHRASSLKREAADEITRLRTALSEAEQRVKDARRAALEEAAQIAERDVDWSAFGKKEIGPRKDGDDSLRDYRLGILVGRVISSHVRRALQSDER